MYDAATTDIYASGLSLSLRDALPIYAGGRVRLTHGQREAAEHRRAAGREHRRLRQRLAAAVAVEVADDADALLVGAAEAGVFAVVALEHVGDIGAGQARGREPAGGPGEGQENGRGGGRERGCREV